MERSQLTPAPLYKQNTRAEGERVVVSVSLLACAMDDLFKLEKLSLVSKICVELENHLGINDKDVGELDAVCVCVCVCCTSFEWGS